MSSFISFQENDVFGAQHPVFCVVCSSVFYHQHCHGNFGELFFLNFTLFIENGKLISDRHITSFTLEYINFKDYKCRIIYMIICVVFFVSAMNWSRLPTAGWCQFWSPSLLSMSWCLPLLQPPYVVVVPQSEPPRYTL